MISRYVKLQPFLATIFYFEQQQGHKIVGIKNINTAAWEKPQLFLTRGCQRFAIGFGKVLLSFDDNATHLASIYNIINWKNEQSWSWHLKAN